MLESLIACGAFDSIERNRARLLGGARRRAALGGAARARSATSPQLGLFGGGAAARSTRRRRRCPRATPWSAEEELRREREALGFFITGHPLDRYEKDLRTFTNITVGTLRTRGPELPAATDAPGRRRAARACGSAA